MRGLRYYEYLAHEAAQAVRRREERREDYVRGLGEDGLEWELRVWRAIEAEWHWVTTLEHREVEGASQAECVELLQRSVRRATKVYENAIADAPRDIRRNMTPDRKLAELAFIYGADFIPISEAYAQLSRIEDLLEWAQRSGKHSIRALVNLNIAIRDSIAADRREAA